MAKPDEMKSFYVREIARLDYSKQGGDVDWGGGLERLVQLVKCLVYKHEALKLIPKTYLKVSDSITCHHPSCGKIELFAGGQPGCSKRLCLRKAQQ